MKHKPAPEETDQSQKTIDGPGSQLRKARERQGLDQAKMAAQLHLSQSLIEALEWDDYEKLPAAVFVQGYLRNYARLLGVNEEAVIEAFQQLQPDAQTQPLTRNQPDEVAKDLHKGPRLGTYIVSGLVVLVGILIFFWWQGQLEEESETIVSEEEAGEVEPALSPEQPDSLTLRPQAPPLPAEETVTPEPAPQAQMPAPEAVVEEIPVATEAPAAEPVEPDVALEPVVAEPEPPLEPVEEMQVQVMEETPPPPVAATEGVVVFEFSGPCWVEVRDNTGRARIIGMMRDGVSRRLDAQLGPFRVVIGDIQVARLSVNGDPYDLTRHTRGKVARFTLDPSRL